MATEAVAIPSIIPQLLDRQFGDYFDNLLHQIVVDNRDTIHHVIDSIIAKNDRNSGKGPVALQRAAGGRKNMKNATGAPTYTLKDPVIKPSSIDLRRETVCPKVTRSEIETLCERRDSAFMFSELFNKAATECKAAVDSIIKECQTKKSKFFDSSFYFDKRDALYPEGSPADCTVGEPKGAKRLTDLFPKCQLFVEGASASDILQGGVGDCFLIGAISATAANNRHSIERLFPNHSIEYGVYGVVFYKDGGWEWVIVDDFIATNQGRSGSIYPLYAAPGTPSEIWPCILEKAYAKLHFNWDMIDGGWAREAIVDLTGGADYMIDLYRKDSGMTFKKFCEIVDDDCTIVGCAVGDHVADSDAVGSAGEAGAVFGLFKGHQYGVLDAKECSDGVGFVKARNPWGQSEWTGPYADGAKEWKQFPLHKKELNPVFGDDGDFWMRWEDFKKYMTQVDVVNIFPDNAEVLTMYGKSTPDITDDNTFLLQVVAPEIDLFKSQSQSASKSMPGGSLFAIVASQDDPKTKYNSSTHDRQKSTPYGVMRLAVNKLRQLPESSSDVTNCRDRKIADVQLRERSAMSASGELDPGLYAITVTIEPSIGPRGKEDKIGYFVRVVGPAGFTYSLCRFTETDKVLTFGKCPTLKQLGSANAIAGTLPTTSEASSPLLPTPAVLAAPVTPLTASAPAASIVAAGRAPAVAAVAAPVVASRSPVVGVQTAVGQPEAIAKDELEQLRRSLEEERGYAKHLEQLYKTHDSQLEVAKKKFDAAQAIISQQEQEISALKEKLFRQGSVNSSASPSSKFTDPVKLAIEKAPSTPWDLVGYTKDEWESIVRGTYDIASNQRATISSDEATMGIRSLVTAGFGLDETIEAQAAIRAGSSLSVRDFVKIANDVVMAWGFRRSPPEPTTASEEL
jgi:hypothetical protein